MSIFGRADLHNFKLYILRIHQYIFVLTVLTATISCDRIKSKAEKIVDDTKDELEDKIIAHYNSDSADTKWNKKRFQEFFDFAPTADVKNIYCYADEMGIDHDYTFSFNCNTTTLNKIVSKLRLLRAEEPDNFSEGIQHSFFWWDKEKIKQLTPYYKKGEHEAYWYLWYDKAESKLYYFQFDM